MAISKRLSEFRRDTSGTTMVEFAICIALFLLILFAVLDFGRLGFNWVMTEKAMQRAVRIAAVRPPVCAGVPFYHSRNPSDTSTLDPGARCNATGGDLCDPTPVPACLLTSAVGGTPAGNTANEIWDSISPLLPSGAVRGNILVEYRYNRNLGFLGGPYTPVVIVGLVGSAPDQPYYFEFITPLSALAATAGAANGTDGEMFSETVAACSSPCIPFPAISVQLPAEDMNVGNDG